MNRYRLLSSKMRPWQREELSEPSRLRDLFYSFGIWVGATGKRALRFAGWCSAIFYFILGANFAIMVLEAASMRPRDIAESIPVMIFSFVATGYGINVIWRLITASKNLDSQNASEADAEAEAANNAELAAIIERHIHPKVNNSA
jgi:hypothetical protein